MRKFLVASSLVAALVSGQAAAADLRIPAVQAPMSAGVFSWTTWYVGAFLGAGVTGNASTSEPCAPVGIGCLLLPPRGQSVGYSMSPSAIGGVNAGYNYQIPGSAIVFGIETEFSYLHSKGSASFPGLSVVGGTVSAETFVGHWYNATTARLGWAWDRMLFYSKIGFSLSTLETNITDSVAFGPGTGKRDIIGWAWGGGVEYVLSPNWSMKGEYLWLGLNHTVGVCAQPVPGLGPATNFCSVSQVGAVQTVKIGFNYLLDVGPVYSRY